MSDQVSIDRVARTMPKLDAAMWRDMMAYLRRRHAAICRQWFEELRPLGLDAGLLRIHTSNKVQQNYLQKKCLEQFTEAAQATTGALVAVRFVNGDDRHNDELEPPATPPPVVTPAGRSPASLRPHNGSAPGHAAAERGGSHSGPSQGRAGAAHAEALFEPVVISPDYSFESFVPGPGNQLALAAAQAVANQPGASYNPLFIHGGVGLGKTHLLQAICQRVLQKNHRAHICYLSCDTFTNQFIDCVQRGLMDEFRLRYRHVDVLVIDDIHFLANKDRTQEEFFHTFNELHQSRKQIVLSSDAAPSEIPQLEERLVSRFQWGLVANIIKPDYETRMAIVRAKTSLRGLVLPEDVISYIATKIDSNARELEGAITTIQGNSALLDKPIDLAVAQKVLGEPDARSHSSQVTLQNIIDVVTAYYSVKLSDLQSKRRHKSITLPRQVCMWLARKHTRFSLQEIGGYFGGRDHTTVMHSIQAIEERTARDGTFSQQVTQLHDRIANPPK